MPTKKRKTKGKPVVGILMGSDSDWPTMKAIAEICAEFGVECEAQVLSAHRNPEDAAKYAKTAHARGIKVIVGGAGGAAHLPGVIASLTPLPVIGVPIESKALKGMDSLLSIVQMPPGVPVATVGIGAAKNAGLLAMQILGVSDAAMRNKMLRYKEKMGVASKAKTANLKMD